MDTTQQGDSVPPSTQNDLEEVLLTTSGEPEKHHSEAPAGPSELEGSDLKIAPETQAADLFLNSLSNPASHLPLLKKTNSFDELGSESQHAIGTSNSTCSFTPAPANLEASPTVARSQPSAIRLPSLFSPTELSVKANWKDASENILDHGTSRTSEPQEIAAAPVEATDLKMNTVIDEKNGVCSAATLETVEVKEENQSGSESKVLTLPLEVDDVPNMASIETHEDENEDDSTTGPAVLTSEIESVEAETELQLNTPVGPSGEHVFDVSGLQSAFESAADSTVEAKSDPSSSQFEEGCTVPVEKFVILDSEATEIAMPDKAVHEAPLSVSEVEHGEWASEGEELQHAEVLVLDSGSQTEEEFDEIERLLTVTPSEETEMIDTQVQTVQEPDSTEEQAQPPPVSENDEKLQVAEAQGNQNVEVEIAASIFESPNAEISKESAIRDESLDRSGLQLRSPEVQKEDDDEVSQAPHEAIAESEMLAPVDQSPRSLAPEAQVDAFSVNDDSEVAETSANQTIKVDDFTEKLSNMPIVEETNSNYIDSFPAGNVNADMATEPGALDTSSEECPETETLTADGILKASELANHPEALKVLEPESAVLSAASAVEPVPTIQEYSKAELLQEPAELTTGFKYPVTSPDLSEPTTLNERLELLLQASGWDHRKQRYQIRLQSPVEEPETEKLVEEELEFLLETSDNVPVSELFADTTRKVEDPKFEVTDALTLEQVESDAGKDDLSTEVVQDLVLNSVETSPADERIPSASEQPEEALVSELPEEVPASENIEKSPISDSPDGLPAFEPTEEVPAFEPTEEVPAFEPTEELASDHTEEAPGSEQTEEFPAFEQTGEEPVSEHAEEAPGSEQTEQVPAFEQTKAEPVSEHFEESPASEGLQKNLIFEMEAAEPGTVGTHTLTTGSSGLYEPLAAPATASGTELETRMPVTVAEVPETKFQEDEIPETPTGGDLELRESSKFDGKGVELQMSSLPIVESAPVTTSDESQEICPSEATVVLQQATLVSESATGYTDLSAEQPEVTAPSVQSARIMTAEMEVDSIEREGCLANAGPVEQDITLQDKLNKEPEAETVVPRLTEPDHQMQDVLETSSELEPSNNADIENQCLNVVNDENQQLEESLLTATERAEPALCEPEETCDTSLSDELKVDTSISDASSLRIVQVADEVPDELGSVNTNKDLGCTQISSVLEAELGDTSNNTQDLHFAAFDQLKDFSIKGEASNEEMEAEETLVKLLAAVEDNVLQSSPIDDREFGFNVANSSDGYLNQPKYNEYAELTIESASDSEAESSVTSVSLSEVPPQVTYTVQNPTVVKLTDDSSYPAPPTALSMVPEESPRDDDTTASSAPSSARSKAASEVSGEDTEGSESTGEETAATASDNDEATTVSGTETISRPSTAQSESESETCASASVSEKTSGSLEANEVNMGLSSQRVLEFQRDDTMPGQPEHFLPSIKSGTFEVTAEPISEDETADDSSSKSSEDDHRPETSVSNSEPVEPLVGKLETYPVFELQSCETVDDAILSDPRQNFRPVTRIGGADENNNIEVDQGSDSALPVADMIYNDGPQKTSEGHLSTAMIEESELVLEGSVSSEPKPVQDDSVFHDLSDTAGNLITTSVRLNEAIAETRSDFTDLEDEPDAVSEATVPIKTGVKLEFAGDENMQGLEPEVAGSLQSSVNEMHNQRIQPSIMSNVSAEEDLVETESITSASNTLADLCEIDDETADEKSVSEADSTKLNLEFNASPNLDASMYQTGNYLSTVESPIVLNLTYEQPMSIPVTMHFLDQMHVQKHENLEDAYKINTDLPGGAGLPDSYVQEISDSESSVQEPKVVNSQVGDQTDRVIPASEVNKPLENALNPEYGTEEPDRRCSNSLLTIQGVEALINPQFLQEKLLAWQNQQQSFLADRSEASSEETCKMEPLSSPVVPAGTISEVMTSDVDENSNLTPKLAPTEDVDCIVMPENDGAHKLLIERQECETVEIAHVLIDAAIATGMLLTRETESVPYTELQEVLVPDMIIQGNQHGLAPAFLSSNYQDSEPEGFEDEELLLKHTLDVIPDPTNFNGKGFIAGRSAATSVSLDDLSGELKSFNEPLGARFYDKFAQHTESTTEFLPPSKQIMKDDDDWIDACTSSSELNTTIVKPEAVQQKTGIDVYVQQDAIPSIPDTPKPMVMPSLASTEVDPSLDKMPLFPKPSVLSAIFGCFRKKNKVKNDPKK